MWQSQETTGHSIEFKIYEFKSVDRQTIERIELEGSKKFTKKHWEILRADPLFAEYFGKLVAEKW